MKWPANLDQLGSLCIYRSNLRMRLDKMGEVERIFAGLNKAPTILCVDDEKIILTSLQEQLRNNLNGVNIEIAESGEEGLEVLQDLLEDDIPVPVIVSDQLMPGMREWS